MPQSLHNSRRVLATRGKFGQCERREFPTRETLMVTLATTNASIAQEIKRALDTCTQVEPFTSRMPHLSLDDAYEAAQLLREMRTREGAKVVGRKIGFTNSNLWPIYDVHQPIWGYVYDRTLTRAPEARAACSLRGLADPRIEPEIMFGLKHALRGEVSVRDIVDAIEWIACGFEIVQSHFPDWKFKVADTVIDGGLHGKLIVGPPMPLSSLGNDPVAALASFTIELSRDGTHVETGKGSNALGSPLNAMRHLASVVAGHGGHAALAPGEIVTTGTLTLAYPIRAGETWTYTVAGLPLPGFTLALAD
jgi:2-keto-4-pentenoate hydratase